MPPSARVCYRLRLDPAAHLELELRGTQDNLVLNLGYQVRDFDGDTAAGTLTLTVRDDAPSAGTVVAATVDEDALLGGVLGQTGDSATPIAVTNGILTHNFGADGTATSGAINFAALAGIVNLPRAPSR